MRHVFNKFMRRYYRDELRHLKKTMNTDKLCDPYFDEFFGNLMSLEC